MKYLNTKYKLFLENLQNINKYEIVEFTQEYVMENIFGGDKNISVSIKKGEKVKLYFDIEETNETQYVVTAIRPIEASENENNNLEKDSFKLSELWEGNFILDTPVTISKSDSPFKIENYL